MTLTQLRKKKIGPNKYNKGNKNKVTNGISSSKKVKNKTSAIKKTDPGKPKKRSKFIKAKKNSRGQRKFKPLISVTNRVLKRRLIASTKKNEFDEISAWLISIPKLASKRGVWPLNTQIVNQCISTTVEYATNFFKSTW
jgi:hypothetical protein